MQMIARGNSSCRLVFIREPKLSALLRELSWTNNLLILGKCKRDEEREFYLRLAASQKWSSRELERQLNGDSVRAGRAVASEAVATVATAFS